MNPRYPAIAERAAHRCEYCRAPEVIFNFRFEVEHIDPRSSDADNETNLALSCRSCNVHKSDRTTEVDLETGEVSTLFHPRTDIWEEHFNFDPVTGNIVGTTARGRVTVTCLRMNTAIHIRARRRWAELGLFP